jgi:Phospholipase_D-nuclease N-terminal
MAKKKWSDLSAFQKRAVYVGGALESVLTAAALWDLVRRPASEVRGPKLAWAVTFVVQPFGPIAYFVAARL